MYYSYICWNSLYNLTTINKSNALTKKRKKSGVCGCGRTVISPSNHFIWTEWNNWTGYQPVYLRRPVRLCTHCAWPWVFHTARRLDELAVQEWQRKERKKEKAATKKRLDKTRDQTRINVSMAFQQWRELRELKWLKSDAVSNDSHVHCLRSLWWCQAFSNVNETCG